MGFLRFLEGIRNPVLDFFFSFVTKLGEETAFMAVAIIIFWCFSKKDGYSLFARTLKEHNNNVQIALGEGE